VITKTIDFYLAPKVLDQMLRGDGHQFFSIAKECLEKVGHKVNMFSDTPINLLASATSPNHAMFHFKDTNHQRAVDVRRTAIGPFYSIEKEPLRWNYRLVDTAFDPSNVPSQTANGFFHVWEKLVAQHVEGIEPRGFVLVALQGKLLDHRRGQEMSPIDMLKATIAQETSRQILIKFHPKEKYTEAELAAVRGLCNEPRVQIYEGDLNRALQNCAYIVSQNSSVILKGLFYRKPSIVFAECEYHHPFQSLRKNATLASAFSNVLINQPAFEKFAYWYFQCNCINTSREWAGDMILQQLRDFGWKI
jgi:hypothetical protein